MDRRDFLSAPKKAKHKQVPFATPPRTLSGIAPYSGTWGTNEIIHLLKRTMFGASKADVDFFRTMTMNQAVDYLLNISAAQLNPSPPVKTYANSVDPLDPDNAITTGSTWVSINTNDGGVNAQRVNSLKSWWIGRQITQERNMLEKLVLFWHNHFATETVDISRAIWAYQNNTIIRKNVIGNFKTFVREITLDTGMLRYLNGYLNTATAPDENYARELQELFTVGKGANNATPPYSEDDVKQAAKVLTGWQVNNTTNTTIFTASRHSTVNKTFSSFYNNTTITGRTGATAGDLELDDLLTMIFNTNDVALNICRKLYRFFIYYTIDANAEANVIAPLAQVFRSSNYDIKTVLLTLFKSEHFFDVANQGCIIKQPLDNLVGMCREWGVTFPDVVANPTAAYNAYFSLHALAVSQQQNIGDPPNVAGWQAYYQEPQFHELWINSDTYPKRNQVTDQMLLTGYTRSGTNIKIDPTIFAKSMPNPGDPNQLISDSIIYLLRLPLTVASRDQLKKDILLGGQTQDYYWTNAWTAWIANPNDAVNANIVKTRLRDLYQYLMKLSEYQLS